MPEAAPQPTLPALPRAGLRVLLLLGGLWQPGAVPLRVRQFYHPSRGCCHLCRVGMVEPGDVGGHLYCASVFRCSCLPLAFFFFSWSSRISVTCFLSYLPGHSAVCLPSALPFFFLSPSEVASLGGFFFFFWQSGPVIGALALLASVSRLSRLLLPMVCSCSRWIDVVLLRSLRAGA